MLVKREDDLLYNYSFSLVFKCILSRLLFFTGLFSKVKEWVFKMLVGGWLNIREKE